MLDEVADAGVFAEVEVDELSALLLGEVGLASDALGAKSVDDPEIEDFGDAPLVAGDVLDAVHGACRGIVDVFAVAEGFQETGFAGHVGEDAELDLGVVGGEELPTRLVVGSEGVADSSAEGCSDRDVLDVGVVRCESSRGGSGLVKGAVDASGGRVDHLGKRVGVGGL